tara:strand:- start:2018 stop:2464 length:447 start_codon:yes stop_codon:yes gene_type:complete
MSKKYDKAELIKLLTGLQSHLSEHTGDFPGLSPAVVALSNAAQDLMTPQAVKVAVKQEKKAAKVKPVSIDYQGKDLLVKTPWGQAGRALANTFKAIVGKRSKSINPDTGEPYFLTVFDKRVKAHRIPKDKEAEVMAAIKASGLPMVAS